MAIEPEISSLEQDVAAAQETLRRAGTSSGEAAANLVGVAGEQLSALTVKLQAMRNGAIEGGKSAMSAADSYVHGQPWHTAVTAGCIGLVVGLLISRR